MKRTTGITFFLAMLMPAVAHAEIIMCKDERGRTFTSDRPIAECQGRALRKYGKTGTVVREIPAPLTEEEKQRKKEEEERLREVRRANEAQRRMDRALLATYSSENEIVAARVRVSKPLHDRLADERQALQIAEQKLASAKEQFEQHGNSADATGHNLKLRMSEAEKMLRYRQTRVREIEDEISQIYHKYEATLKRFRILTMENTVDKTAKQ